MQYEGRCIKVWNELNRGKITLDKKNNCYYLDITADARLN